MIQRKCAALPPDVRSAILELIPEGHPTVGSVAHRLDVSARSLQRHLAAYDITHTQLVDSVRLDMAFVKLTQGDLSVATIACQLGYRDASNFSRAFKRWTGQSPRRWRSTHARDCNQ